MKSESKKGIVLELFRAAPNTWRRLLLVAGFAGLANTGILVLVNRGAASAAVDSATVEFRLVLLFGLCLLAFYVGKRYSLTRACITVENMVESRLLSVSDKIRCAELEVVEHLTKGELFTKIGQDTNLISQSALILVNAAEQSFVLLFCIAYIAWLSPLAFVAFMLMIGVAFPIYIRHSQALGDLLKQSTASQGNQLDALGHIIDGFKEIRLNQSKSDGVFREFTAASARVRDLRIETQMGFCVNMMFSDIAFYCLLSVVVFLLPRLYPPSAASVLMTTAAILFAAGPLTLIVTARPVFQRAMNALTNLSELESRLDSAVRPARPGPVPGPLFRNLQRIESVGACYTYRSDREDEGFSVGPLNLQIGRGELIFLVGGNGAGKTTILKILTGLYTPQRGELKVDGRLIGPQTILAYRELFSTVFSDFHLFDRLYGLDGIEDARVVAVLKEMELSDKTRFERGRFTTQNLSTGQRKRLALAIALLENKDILVLDEWAADQDSYFRKHFYEVILPQLKIQGKTVIATSHDEDYWRVADRVIHI